MKMRRLGRLELDATLQILIGRVNVARVQETMQITAANRRAHEIAAHERRTLRRIRRREHALLMMRMRIVNVRLCVHSAGC